MRGVSWASTQWKEGERHGFPRCCRARFILSHGRPKPLEHLAPGIMGRLRRLTPRFAVADGMVPCEYHLLKWLWNGDRRGWRDPLDPENGECCEVRQDLERGGVVSIRQERYEDEELFSEPYRPWMLFLLDENGGARDGISITACPWCGVPLE